MGSLLIDVNNVSKTYRSINSATGFTNKVVSLFRPTYSNYQVLKEISFTLFSGKALAIVGSNGAGKSTLIKILSGIQAADEGDVTVLGFHPYKAKKICLSLSVLSLVIKIAYGGIYLYATVWIWLVLYMILKRALLTAILKKLPSS
ncbi:ATP-binding cassette domain-containing protein [Bartonella massiliensis]|uniref:ATP-binding cassette domain-containing protein n=1 Tax=Bartonella massiliensis TaxID=929795 RepID=UPI00248271A2|nr:ATP-binding cassette domain-containing protein [Bartonella massiliensis]